MITSILLLGLCSVCLLSAAIFVMLAQLVRPAPENPVGIRIVVGFVIVVGLLLAFPMIIAFAYIVDMLEGLVGTRCPACGRRELEWRNGTWKYGDPPEYKDFECTSCGARFRQLCGGHGVLSDLERV